MRVVLLGDSHLARLRRELPRLGESVVNAAVGGATVLDLEAQADRVGLAPDDAVVVSVGTNDAATRNEVPVLDFRPTTDGLHLSGEGYRALLPVLARAVGV